MKSAADLVKLYQEIQSDHVKAAIKKTLSFEKKVKASCEFIERTNGRVPPSLQLKALIEEGFTLGVIIESYEQIHSYIPQEVSQLVSQLQAQKKREQQREGRKSVSEAGRRKSSDGVRRYGERGEAGAQPNQKAFPPWTFEVWNDEKMENRAVPRRFDQIGTRAFAIDKSRRFRSAAPPVEDPGGAGAAGVGRILRRHERKPPQISKENQNLQWILKKRRPKSVRNIPIAKANRIRRRHQSDITYDMVPSSQGDRRIPRQPRLFSSQAAEQLRKRRIVAPKQAADQKRPSLAVPSDKEIRDILLRAGAFTRQGEPSHPPTSGDTSPKKANLNIGVKVGEPSSVSRSRVRSISNEEPGARLTSAERIFQELRDYRNPVNANDWAIGGSEIPIVDIPDEIENKIPGARPKRKREPFIRNHRDHESEHISVVGIDGIGFAQTYVKRKCNQLSEEEIERFLKKKGLTQAEIDAAWSAVDPKRKRGGTTNAFGEIPSLTPSTSSEGSLDSHDDQERAPSLKSDEIQEMQKQRMYLRFNSRHDASLLEGDDLQRYRVISELIETEKGYVKHLKQILSDFLTPLRERGFITSQSGVGRMENIVKELLEGQSWFLKSLLRAESILDVFLLPKASKLFKTYNVYVDVYKNWSEALEKMRRNRKARKFLDTLVDPDLLFLSPVQRPPRYLLLLQQMKKSTPPEHPRFPDLLKTIDQVKLLVQYTNTVHEARSLRRILSVRIKTRESTQNHHQPESYIVSDNSSTTTPTGMYMPTSNRYSR